MPNTRLNIDYNVNDEFSVWFDPSESIKPKKKNVTKFGLNLNIIEKNMLERLIDYYYEKCDYKLRWIFHRIEKNGIQRRTIPFTDINEIAEKMSIGHSRNNDNFTYFEWNLKGIDIKLIIEAPKDYNYEIINIYLYSKKYDKIFGVKVYKFGNFMYDCINEIWSKYD